MRQGTVENKLPFEDKDHREAPSSPNGCEVRQGSLYLLLFFLIYIIIDRDRDLLIYLLTGLFFFF
ncbi:MAG: hypothetical protein BTN85_1581 [Candidatus Methanohalarchaeum thermophilum]|uniref:Uncharacterized protein n=1 Tax=Methanohalarchaeum thermophilum TaxID=1903181 RepID=A0A1Q6DXI3_METT1|nr:MAG: hypothetical protein BTN85_1581 [Candidatus Methanohalarchaeum thermophilum]